MRSFSLKMCEKRRTIFDSFCRAETSVKLCIFVTCTATRLYFHCAVWMYKNAIRIGVDPDAKIQKICSFCGCKNSSEIKRVWGRCPQAFGRRGIAAM